MIPNLFGDIYLVEEKHLIYLTATHEIMFFAVISSGGPVKSLINLRDKLITSGETKRVCSDQLCFIQLTTEEFEGCIAHPAAGDSEKDFDLELFVDKIGSLNDEDKKELKEIIVDEKTGLNRKLKQLVKDIEL